MSKELQFSPFTGNVFAGRTYAELSLALPEERTMSPAASGWIRAEDVDADGGGAGAKLTSPYSQSAWVYIAISRLAEKVSSIPFRISQMGSEKAKKVRALRTSSDARHRAIAKREMSEHIIEAGAVVDLFDRPHATMNRQLFWEMVVTWNCLRGEFFILPLDGTDQPVDMAASAPRVEGLITLAPELFWHNVVGYTLEGWRYTGSPLAAPIPGEYLLPTEVLHSRTANPFSYWRGMSPLAVAMIAAGADFAASKYNQGYWLNNADTGVIVTTEQQATPTQRTEILAALRERKRKAGTADRPLFLWGGAKVETPKLSGMESQMIENRKMNRQEILAIWKLNDSVIGLTDSKSSALSGGGSAINQDEVKFIESTVSPLCCHIEAAVEPVVRSFGDGLIGWFDVDSLPVMQQARRDRLDAGVKAFAIGAAFNDINRVYDLGFPDYGWGNKSYLPINLIEAGTSPDLPSEESSQTGNGEKDKGNPFSRMKGLLDGVAEQSARGLAHSIAEQRSKNTKAIWERHVLARRSSVKLMESKVGKVLTEYRGRTLSKLEELNLTGGNGDNRGAEARPLAEKKKGLIDLIFSAGDFGRDLVKEMTVPVGMALDSAAVELMQELGIDDPWTMAPSAAKDYMAARTQPIQDVGGTVRDQINTSLNAGFDAGETMGELTDRVRQVFTTLSKSEAKRVAMTETNMAYNASRHAGMKANGIQWKAWLSSHGPHVRPAHALAETAYIDNPVPIDEPYIVMLEKLQFPGDTSLGASAGNIINCQCVSLAAKKRAEDGKAITFEIGGCVMAFEKLKD